MTLGKSAAKAVAAALTPKPTEEHRNDFLAATSQREEREIRQREEREKEKEKRVQHMAEMFARRFMKKDLSHGWTAWLSWWEEKISLRPIALRMRSPEEQAAAEKAAAEKAAAEGLAAEEAYRRSHTGGGVPAEAFLRAARERERRVLALPERASPVRASPVVVQASTEPVPLERASPLQALPTPASLALAARSAPAVPAAMAAMIGAEVPLTQASCRVVAARVEVDEPVIIEISAEEIEISAEEVSVASTNPQELHVQAQELLVQVVGVQVRHVRAMLLELEGRIEALERRASHVELEEHLSTHQDKVEKALYADAAETDAAETDAGYADAAYADAAARRIDGIRGGRCAHHSGSPSAFAPDEGGHPMQSEAISGSPSAFAPIPQLGTLATKAEEHSMMGSELPNKEHSMGSSSMGQIESPSSRGPELELELVSSELGGVSALELRSSQTIIGHHRQSVASELGAALELTPPALSTALDTRRTPMLSSSDLARAPPSSPELAHGDAGRIRTHSRPTLMPAAEARQLPSSPCINQERARIASPPVGMPPRIASLPVGMPPGYKPPSLHSGSEAVHQRQSGSEAALKPGRLSPAVGFAIGGHQTQSEHPQSEVHQNQSARVIQPSHLSPTEVLAAPLTHAFLNTLSTHERAFLIRILEAAYAAGAPLDAYSAATYCRFCVSNKWEEAPTLQQIRRTIEWRRSGEGMGLNQVRAELLAGVPLLQLSGGWGDAVARVNVFIPGHPFLGTTRRGDPFEVCVPGRLGLNRLDGSLLLEATTDDEFWRCNLAFMEYRAVKCDRLCLEGDRTLKSVYMVSDGAGFTLSFLWKVYKRFARTAPVADMHYPLYLRKSLLLNAPSTVHAVYAIFKPMLSRDITDTFHIFRTVDAPKAAQLLCADVDPSIVPVCYGGELARFSREMRAEIGLDALEPRLLAQQFAGPPESMGGFHKLGS